MLILVLSFLLVHLFCPSTFLLLIQLVVILVITIYININNFFLEAHLSSSWQLVDNWSLFIVTLLVFISVLMYINLSSNNESFIIINILVVTLISFCWCVFTANSLLLLYINYELSLFPIIYIIIIFGNYPNRYLSVTLLFLYTSLFAVPYLSMMLLLFNMFNSLSFIWLVTFQSSLVIISTNFTFVSILIALTFLVNLPCYGLHFWLPMAHVEAPTFGSMLLAGILLNLGIISLFRFSVFFISNSLVWALQSYFIFSLIMSTVICCYQSDFNALVAYSSVSHMGVIPILIFSNSKIFTMVSLLVAVFHGFSSVFIFILVSILIIVYNTRQIVFMHGLVFIFPVLAGLSLLGFISSVSMPPFSSFFSEVLAFSAFISFNFINLSFLFIFSFVSGVYSVQWLSLILFSSSATNISFINVNYLILLSLCFVLLLFFPYLVLLNFVCC